MNKKLIALPLILAVVALFAQDANDMSFRLNRDLSASHYFPSDVGSRENNFNLVLWGDFFANSDALTATFGKRILLGGEITNEIKTKISDLSLIHI